MVKPWYLIVSTFYPPSTHIFSLASTDFPSSCLQCIPLPVQALFHLLHILFLEGYPYSISLIYTLVEQVESTSDAAGFASLPPGLLHTKYIYLIFSPSHQPTLHLYQSVNFIFNPNNLVPTLSFRFLPFLLSWYLLTHHPLFSPFVFSQQEDKHRLHLHPVGQHYRKWSSTRVLTNLAWKTTHLWGFLLVALCDATLSIYLRLGLAQGKYWLVASHGWVEAVL